MFTALLFLAVVFGVETFAQSKKAESPLTMINKETDFSDEYLVSLLPGFSNHYAAVNETELHYVQGGKGSPILLLAGWPQTWWSYHKIMPILAEQHTVIAIDIRGMGASGKPEDGYTKKNMASDIASLVKSMGLQTVTIAGHDIGANVAISFAGHYPEITEKLIVLDTQHPEEDLYKLPMLPVGLPVHPWWVAFSQTRDLPETLLEGRFHLIQEWLFEKMLFNRDNVSDFDRKVYGTAYESKDAIRASNAWYQAFPEDIQDIKTMDQIQAPTLAIASAGSYAMLQASLPRYIAEPKFEQVKDSGHFLAEEQPEIVADLILKFTSTN